MGLLTGIHIIGVGMELKNAIMVVFGVILVIIGLTINVGAML